MKQPAAETARRSLWTSAPLSACLALAVVAELVGIGVYGYYRVQRMLDPDRLANRAEEAIRDNYPEFRAELIAEIKLQAPEIAAQVSEQLVASTPAARQQLEEFTARQLDQGIGLLFLRKVVQRHAFERLTNRWP